MKPIIKAEGVEKKYDKLSPPLTSRGYYEKKNSTEAAFEKKKFRSADKKKTDFI